MIVSWARVAARNVTSGLALFGIRNKMTLKSALQDVKDTTLSAVSGLLGKLAYLASLRHKHGSYQHWGMENVYGPEASDRALKTVHVDVLKGVLRTPLPRLEEDLKVSCRAGGLDAGTYLEQLRGQLRGFTSGRTPGFSLRPASQFSAAGAFPFGEESSGCHSVNFIATPTTCPSTSASCG